MDSRCLSHMQPVNESADSGAKVFSSSLLNESAGSGAKVFGTYEAHI